MATAEDPAELLLAEAPLEPVAAAAENAAATGGRILILEGGSGLLLERFSRPGTEIHFHNSDYNRHAEASARLGRLDAARSATAHCLLGDLPRAVGPAGAEAAGDAPGGEAWPGALEFPAGSFDAVLYRLGKGTAALHGAILEAWKLLRPGGSLFLAGHTREGVKSLAKHTEEHFGHAELLSLKSSCRLIRFQKSGAAPRKPLPDPGYFTPVPLVLMVPGLGAVPYVSKPGVFSYRATDAGTALLARHLQAMPGWRVLDLGCGSGVLSLAAIRLGAREVTAVDSSAAAVSAARRNLAESAGAAVAAQVHCTNMTEGVEGEFDLILSNPPFHQGAETDYSLPSRILDAALVHLAPGGRMLLVANQFLDYPAQARGRFAVCETLAQENGYRVLALSR